MKPFLEENFVIRASETDFKNRLRISSFFTCLQDVASLHASQLNVGFKDLSEQNLLWVLYWARLEVFQYPGFADSITVRTWPKQRYKLYFLRDFFIFNNKKKIIAKASTAWLLIKSDTKRLADLKNLNFNLPFTSEHALEIFPEKIKFNTNQISPQVFRRRINYSDIDINQHVNNARYFEFIFDCFEEKFYNKILQNITTNFLSEGKYGDEMELLVYSKEENDLVKYVEIKNMNNGKLVLQSLIKMKNQ